MKQKLYIPIRKFSPRFAHFAFFDTKDYLADPLFIRHQVRVWFGKELSMPDSPYRILLCHVRKQDVPEFLAALEELKNSMLICGYTDYESVASMWMDRFEQMKGGDENNGKNDPVGEAKQGQTA